MRPTPYPAKKRPAMNSGCDVEAVCRITPRLNTRPAETMSPIRLPSKSPNGAAVKAPKKVPAERIETIRESWAAVMLRSGSVENCCFQYLMAMMPLIVPVSYLKFVRT
jgi:hypothetical protein